MNNDLLIAIQQAAKQKVMMNQNHPLAYVMKAFFAGVYLTLAGVVSLYISQNFAGEASALGKLLNALIFGVGLVIIIMMKAELATSNMMFLTSGVLQKSIRTTQGLKVLGLCTLGNLIGCLFTAGLLSLSTPYQAINHDALLYTTVASKVFKPVAVMIVDAILANILVNIAVIGQMQLKNEMARLTFIILTIFIFVYFGFEHVIANFGSFSLAYFLDSAQIVDVSLIDILWSWVIVFIGNAIGGNAIMGVFFTLTEKAIAR